MKKENSLPNLRGPTPQIGQGLIYCNCCIHPQGSTLGMNATLKNESPVGDTYTEKNPRLVPEGRWRMPRPSGTGFFTYLFILNSLQLYNKEDGGFVTV